MSTEIVVRSQLSIAEPLPLDRNPAAVYLAGLASGSRRTMRQALGAIAALLIGGAPDALAVPWWDLRYQHVAAIRSQLIERYSPASASKMLCALRGVLREAWRLELIGESDYRRAIDVKGVRGERLPPGRALSLGEVSALFDACTRDASAAGARDAAMLAVLFAGGLRRSEVAALDLADYNEVDGLKVRKGKGAKDRLVPFAAGGGAAAVLLDWLKVRGVEPGPLFVPIDKGGHVFTERLSSQAIYNALAKRARQAGVENFSPHDCRRTLISHLLEGGADLVVVSKIAGHASVTTTARYDRRGEEAKRRAIELFHVPYRGRK